ncbi:MAG: hypothetical protein ABH823_01075 [bacterium]
MSIGALTLACLLMPAGTGPDDIGKEITAYAKKHPSEAKPDLAYLMKLVKRAGLSITEVRGILTSSPKGTGLVRLWAFALLKKIDRQEQMSDRYYDFLSRTAQLIWQGKIKFDTTRPGRFASSTGAKYYPDRDTINISTSPLLFADEAGTVKSEATLVHELFHAFQDDKHKPLPRSQSEAEAYLVAADYQVSESPGTMKDTWIALTEKPDGSYGLGFGLPRKYATLLKNKSVHHSAYEPTLQLIRTSYLETELFLEAYHSEEARGRERELGVVARRSMDLGLQFNLADFSTKAITAFTASKADHVKPVAAKPAGFYLQYSAQLTDFLGSMRIAADMTWQLGSTWQRKSAVQSFINNEVKALFCITVKLPTINDPVVDARIAYDGIK